jgi:hypothetical protein
MATQSSQVVIKVTGTLANTATGTLATATDVLNVDYTQNFGAGTGAGLANVIYRAQRTLSAAGTEDLDLSGTALTDGLGTAVALTKLKAIIVHAAAGNTNNVKVGGGNTTVPIFGDVSDLVSVKPGGTLVLTDPSAGGITVTNSSADLLTITNSAGTTGVTYDLILIGA